MMPPNIPPAAPQTAQDGAEAGEGRCTDTSEMEAACRAQNPGLASMFGEPVDWWVVERLEALAVAHATEWQMSRYRAALAAGVYYGN